MEGMKMTDKAYKTVDFEVIEIWYNDIYTPYTFKPLSNKSTKEYAVKIGDDVFHLGTAGDGLHICDQELNA